MAFVVFLTIQVAVVLVAILLLRRGTSNRIAQKLGTEATGDDLRLFGWVCVAAAVLSLLGASALSSPIQTLVHAVVLLVALVGGIAGAEWWDSSTSVRERHRALAHAELAGRVGAAGTDLDLAELRASADGLDDPLVRTLVNVRCLTGARADRLRSLERGLRAARSREQTTWLLAARAVVNADSPASHARDLDVVLDAGLAPHPLAAALLTSVAASGHTPLLSNEVCRTLATACLDVADARLLRRPRAHGADGAPLTSPGRRDGGEPGAPPR